MAHTTPKEKNPVAVYLGKRGGLATKKKHGKSFFSRIGRKGRSRDILSDEIHELQRGRDEMRKLEEERETFSRVR